MKALVISGGGVTGAYHAGAITFLSELGLEFDIVCGSSVGALTASYLSQFNKKDFKKASYFLNKFWRQLERKDVYKRWFPFGKLHALWNKSLYNSKPLHKLVNKHIDEQKLLDSGVELRIGTTSVNTGEYKTYDQYSEHIMDIITASASFPPFFYPVKVGKEYEYDAGIREYTPIKAAIDAGATEIYVLCSEPEKMGVVNNPSDMNTIDVFKRMVYTLSNEVIINDFNQVEKVNNNIKLGLEKNKKHIVCHLVRPANFLVQDSLDFSHEEIERLICHGYNDAKKQIKF